MVQVGDESDIINSNRYVLVGRPPDHRAADAPSVAVAAGEGGDRPHPQPRPLPRQPRATQGERLHPQARTPPHQSIPGM